MSNTNDVRGAEDKTDTWRDDVVAMIPHLRAVAQSLSRNAADADDLVQECLIKAWSHRESFTPGTNLRAWLFTILRNTFYTMTRKRQREVADPSGAYAATLRSEPVQEWRAQLEDLRRALDSLPAHHRESLILVAAAGLSYEEAAEICGCAVGTIKSRVNRARAQLAGLLNPSDGAPDKGGVIDSLLALAA